MGNLVLQAQNMGQPFLLTPTYDRSVNPLMNSQGAPPTSLASGVNPNVMKDLEQLKQQYERTTQLIQQQLLLSQMTSMMTQQSQQQPPQHHQADGGGSEGTGDGGTSQTGGGGGGGGGGGEGQMEGTNLASQVVSTSLPGGTQGPSQVRGVAGGGDGSTTSTDRDSGLGSQGADAEVQANQFINGSDVMIGSRSRSDSLLRRTRVGGEDVGDLDSEDLASKRPRLDTSVSAL